MSRNRTKTWDTNFDFCHEDRYIDIFLCPIYMQVAVAQWDCVCHFLFHMSRVRIPAASEFFPFFLNSFILNFFNSHVLLYFYETFYYLT
jgi:hypothetical protein